MYHARFSIRLAALLASALACFLPARAGEAPGDGPQVKRRGEACAKSARPRSFPHRFWAACDFEGQTPDYAWFGQPDAGEIPKYPGNRTSLRGEKAKSFASLLAGMNPVPGPRMGVRNGLCLRYLLRGTTSAQVQCFNLTREDNHHIQVSGLVENRWSDVTLDFTNDSARNDGSPGAMEEGDRMDDLKIFAGKAGEDRDYSLWIDDVLFFADDPAAPPDPEPFPNRVITLAAFDTGEKERYWKGDLEIVEDRKGAPAGTYWRCARAVPRKDGKGKLVSLMIDPPRPVGERTKVRFRYHLTGATAMTVQIFDLTAMDNRHVRLTKLREGAWETVHVDFTRDSRRNDGSDGPFTAGNKVDDLFFFVEPEGEKPLELHVDEIVLYDAARAEKP